MMKYFRVIRRILFPPDLDYIFSEEGKEQTALAVAGCGRVTTKRMFAEEMRQLERRTTH